MAERLKPRVFVIGSLNVILIVDFIFVSTFGFYNAQNSNFLLKILSGHIWRSRFSSRESLAPFRVVSAPVPTKFYSYGSHYLKSTIPSFLQAIENDTVISFVLGIFNLKMSKHSLLSLPSDSFDRARYKRKKEPIAGIFRVELANVIAWHLKLLLTKSALGLPRAELSTPPDGMSDT